MTKTSLKAKLDSFKPRENAGPRSGNRFDYQHNWALCKLVELHKSGDPYVLLLDYHDDVVVVDSITEPTTISFFQVKTKKIGNYKCTDLWRRPTGKSKEKLGSILGKLYSNYIAFPSETKGLTLVSNASLNAKLCSSRKSEGVPRLVYADLAAELQKEIKAKLEQELGSTIADEGVGLFCYETTDLSLADHHSHTLGKLTSFLDALPAAEKASPAAFYKTLKDEIRRKANNEEAFSSFDIACSLKAIEKAEFQRMLNKYVASSPRFDVVSSIELRLNAERVPFSRVRKICSEARKYIVNRLDPTNRLVAICEACVCRTLHAFPSFDLFDHLIEDVFKICSGDQELVDLSVSPFYLRGIIGVKAIELQELSDTDTDVEDQEV